MAQPPNKPSAEGDKILAEKQTSEVECKEAADDAVNLLERLKATRKKRTNLIAEDEESTIVDSEDELGVLPPRVQTTRGQPKEPFSEETKNDSFPQRKKNHPKFKNRHEELTEEAREKLQHRLRELIAKHCHKQLDLPSLWLQLSLEATDRSFRDKEQFREFMWNELYLDIDDLIRTESKQSKEAATKGSSLQEDAQDLPKVVAFGPEEENKTASSSAASEGRKTGTR